MIDERVIREEMIKMGVWSDEGHYLYSSGLHGNTHYDKYGLSVHPNLLRLLANAFADNIKGDEVDALISPAYSGIPMVHWTSGILAERLEQEVLALYVVKDPEKRKNKFMFVGDMGVFIKNKKVIILEDNINTGESVRELIDLVADSGGKVTKVISVFNRGKVSLGDVKQVSVLNKAIFAWKASECPLCPAPITPPPQRIL